MLFFRFFVRIDVNLALKYISGTAAYSLRYIECTACPVVNSELALAGIFIAEGIEPFNVSVGKGHMSAFIFKYARILIPISR